MSRAEVELPRGLSVLTAVRSRLPAHFQVPMYREGYALVLSGGIASILGLVYWIVVARSYAPQVVGLNSAVISAMTFLMGVAQWNLANALVRFVPRAGAATLRFVVVVYLVSLGSAAAVSLIFLAGLEIWTPTLKFLRDSPGFIIAFTLATMAGAAFNLQHSLLTGLRRAIWVPVENAAFSVSKLGLVLVFARILPLTGIFASWAAGLGLATLPTVALIFGRVMPSHSKFVQEGAVLPGWTQITRYTAADYVGGLCWLASTTLIPIFILREAGAAANAYFSLSWVMVLPLYLIAGNMGSSLVVSGVHDTQNLRTISNRMLKQTALLVVPLAVLMIAAAPYALLLFGRDYSQHGTTLLRLLALATIPGMVNLLYVDMARVRRRMARVMTVMAAPSVLALGLTWICFRIYGLNGVGLAWLLSQSVVAVVVALRLWSERLAPELSVQALATSMAGALSTGLHLARSSTIRSVPSVRLWRIRLEVPDLLPALALLLWIAALRGTRPEALNDYGLVPALPPAFFIALGLLAASFVMALSRSQVSRVRLGLHVAALVLMLYGVVPLIFALPDGDSVYKHFGVVQYIASHGSLNDRVDIYQNWPGFFALAAWFDAIVGAGSPIVYAAWAPIYFNVLAVLAMALAMRPLTTSARLGWAALFIFVATNWVGQDYFSPQAYGFVVSLAVVACLITWFRSDRPAAWVKSMADRVHRLVQAPPNGRDEPSRVEVGDRQRAVLLLAINAGYAAVTFSHQLSPFMVLAGVLALTIAGAVRPRWLVFGPIVISALYLATRLGYLTSNHVLEFSLNPFGNARNQTVGLGQGTAGRLFTATTARVLTLGMWSLGAVGILRRLRQGAPVLVPTLLMAAPAALLFANDYGGEAIYRVYLFSLPWAAFLAAAAIVPTGPWSIWSGVRVAATLFVMLALFLQSYFGLEQINQMRPGEVAASQYFEARAAEGSVLILAAPNFPQRSTGNYDQYVVPSGDFDPSLTNADRFQHRMLTAADLPDVESVVAQYQRRPKTGYVAITTAMKVYSHMFSLLPDGSLDSLDGAMAASPDWRLFYRNKDAVIYQLVASPSTAGSGANQPGAQPALGDSPP